MKFSVAVPVLTDAATDFKPELSKEGMATLTRFVKVLDNLDLSPRYDIIVATLAEPSKVPSCIKSLSSVTFVAEVTEPALSLLVPILDKSLKMSSSSQEQLRQTVKVCENLTRLVNNKREIEKFIPVLMPSVRKVVESASLPEVRDMAGEALNVLQDAESEKSDGQFHGRLHTELASDYLKSLKSTINDDVIYNYLVDVLKNDANVNDWTALSEYFGMALDPYYSEETEKTKIVDQLVHQMRELFTPDAVNESNDDDTVFVDVMVLVSPL
ncbi:unnamed protein product [Ambrosiozyma monospora]|uniref:Unnamed protein product n=1 Tax=Ambrosiozyma monospora TaxID=43982 RepID=A0ACB5TUE0_AMBMO|nr:unnamed protein product [Ambrosiozyma monospora]